MCIGTPMQVIGGGEWIALCQDDAGNSREIDLRLVGPQPEGTRVLVHLDTAREVLSSERADQIQSALAGLQALGTSDFDVARWFPDLANREPELPDFLKERS